MVCMGIRIIRTIMATKAFTKRETNFEQYMAQLEDLLRKNRGSALHTGYDVDPNAILIPGKVKDPSGIGSQQYSQDPRYSGYSPGSIAFQPIDTGEPVTPYEEPPLDLPQGDQGGQQQGISAEDFFQQVAQSIYSPQVPTEQSTAELENIYQNTGQKYAVASNQNGTVTFNDGSVGAPQATAQPIASMQDGNVLWSDGFVRQQLPSYLTGSGVDALSMGLFGREQTVTQPYGNINPIEPTPGNVNVGTDFRTRDLENRQIRNFFAEPLEVVTVYNQARPGSGYVGNFENQGYGNSILLRRSDGSMIRVSHFDQLGDFKVGDMIQPGQTIGVPGSTGNVTGEHADVEVYSPEGQITSPESFLAEISNSSKSNDPLYKYEPQAPQQRQGGYQDAVQKAREFSQQIRQNPIQQAAQAIEKRQPTGDFGLGLTELAQGDVLGAKDEIKRAPGEVIEAVGQAKGIPELGFSEGFTTPQATQARVQQVADTPSYSPTRHLLGNITEKAGDFLNKLKPGLAPERAISEAIAGRPTAQTPQKLFDTIQTKAQASLPQPQNIRQDVDSVIQNVKNPFQQIPQQMGSLISKAKDAFGDVKMPGLHEKPSTLNIDPNSKQVGQVSSQETLASTQPKLSSDNRDPFFKQGGADTFKNYLVQNPDQKLGGALDTSLFTPAFFQSPTAIGDVFGNTSQGKDATNKYKNYLQSKIKPGFDKQYSEREVEEDGNIYKILTPIREYFENQHWKDQLSKVPDILTGDDPYVDSGVPEIKEGAFKGERQLISSDAPVFKSNASNLFREAGDSAAKFVQGIGDSIASIYKPHPFSKTVARPEVIPASFEPESIPASFELPKTQKKFVRKAAPPPTLNDYLRMGKTAAQWYAETGRQGELDKIDKQASFGGVGDFTAFLKSGHVSNPNMAVNPNTGTTYVRAKEDRQNAAAGGVSSGSRQNFTPAYANYTDRRTGNASYAPQPVIKSQTYTPSNANYTSSSGRAVYKPPPAPKPQSNPFVRAFNKIKSWF